MALSGKKIALIFFLFIITISTVLAQGSDAKVFIKSHDMHSLTSRETAAYGFTINNAGSSKDTFMFDVEGIPESWTDLSSDGLTIPAGKEAEFSLTVTPECSAKGLFEFKLKIESENTYSRWEIPLYLNITPAYGFSMELKDRYIACNGDTASIPIKFTNEAGFQNNFRIKLDAPRWVTIDNDHFTLPASSYGTLNLNISPHASDNGAFNITIRAEEGAGETEIEEKTLIIVDTCNMFEVEMLEYDYACAGETLTFPVTIRNTGTEDNFVVLKSWGRFESDIEEDIYINAGSEEIADLTVSIPADFKGHGTVSVGAYHNGIEFTDSIWLDVTDKTGCFLPSVTMEKDILIVEGSVREIPVVIEHKGARPADYMISIGEDHDWILLPRENPVHLDEGGQKVVKFTAFPDEGKKGDYNLTVKLFAEGLTYFKAFRISVADDTHINQENPAKEGIFSRIWGFVCDYVRYFIAGFAILIVVIGLMHFLGERKEKPKKKLSSKAKVVKKTAKRKGFKKK